MACAQNGLEVALKSLNVAVPPPKFVSLLLTSVHALIAAADNLVTSRYAVYLEDLVS